MPERAAGRDLAEVEEVELLAEAPVIAPLCLLDPLEVRVELVLREERGAVDAGQLRARRVAAPVRARERGQLEGLDRGRRLQVRAAAEIDPAIVRVEGDLVVSGQALGELDLERLVVGAEPLDRALARRHAALDRMRAPLEDAAHLVLDPREVGLDGRLGELEVVVEAICDRGPDRDLRSREDRLHGLGQHVRRRVAKHRQRLLIADAHDLELCAVAQRKPQILQRAIELDRGGRCGESLADRARGVEARRLGRQLEAGAVGKRHMHGASLGPRTSWEACHPDG